MEFFVLGDDGPRISRVILGGHEYLPDGRSRGFNENFTEAITPGAISSTSVAKFMYTMVIIMYRKYVGATGAA